MLRIAKIEVRVYAADEASIRKTFIQTTVSPAKTNAPPLNKDYDFTIVAKPLRINLSTPIINTAYGFLSDIIDTFIDEDRELKTLVNYGEDKQTVTAAWRYGPDDDTGTPTIQFKLIKELPNDVELGKRVFISREIANSIVDKVRIRYAPRVDDSPYLRPRNNLVSVVDTGNQLKNVTLKVLQLESGSLGGYTTANNISFEDQIFRRWFSYDFDSSELNLDFTDYNDFVFYGSAAMRLAAFRQKLIELNRLTSESLQFEGSVFTGSLASAGATYILEKSKEFAIEKENIIRSFDRYEQYLYFTPSGSINAYTASAWYADGAFEFNDIAYWPKNISDEPIDPYDTTADDWYTTQSLIAQRYDDFNENNLINTIPTYIREDEDSDAYITFITMIGHFFDLVKPYMDHMPYIYDRYIDPDLGLSKDLVEVIANSVGFKLPTLYSIYDLADNILGTTSDTPRRDFSVETQKRLLHNLSLFAKSKGSRTALETLLKVFGITDQLITVKEEGTPTSSSLYVRDEFTYGLDFDEAEIQYVTIQAQDMVRAPEVRSLQFNFTVAKEQDMTIITGDELWALNVAVHPTIPSLGRIELVSGSGGDVILSSSYEEIFGDELLNATIRTYPGGSNYANLFVAQADGEDLVFSSSLSEAAGANKFVNLWNNTNNIYIGGSGSLASDRFDGTIDEVRLWAINLSNEVVLNTVFDPGSHAGDAYTDASDYLYAQLSFNKIDTASLASNQILNESPYNDKTTIPDITTFTAYNVALNDFIRYSRTIRMVMPDIGQSGFVTRKIKIADPPAFVGNNIDGNGTPKLSRTKSIVTNREKRRWQIGRNKVSIATSPTNIVNQNIIRTMGLENINSILGVPSDFYLSTNTSLENLKTHYSNNYSNAINFNTYIRVLSALSSVLNQVVDYFIPSKATLLQGIVIEQNILERVYVPRLKAMRFYGGSARRTINAPASLTGSKPDYEATFNLSQKLSIADDTVPGGTYDTYLTSLDMEELIPLSGKYNTYKTALQTTSSISLFGEQRNYNGAVEEQEEVTLSGLYRGEYTDNIDLSAVYEFLGNNAGYNGVIDQEDIYDILSTYPTHLVDLDIGLGEMNKIPFNNTNAGTEGAEPYSRLYARKLFDYEIEKTKIVGNKGFYKKALYEIKPSADFDVGAVRNYYSQPEGAYYFPETFYKLFGQRILNATWNFNAQNFTGATTWSYGARYDKNDVVYQNVTKYDTFADELGTLVTGSRGGNDKYYVRTAGTLYVSSSEGDPGYVSGSGIPSYIPPSLDGENWAVVRFSPVEKRIPKRIIFDTVLFSDPKDNDYKTTRIELDQIVNTPSRYIDTFRTGNLTGNGQLQGEIALHNILALFAIQANNSEIRIRFYRTAADRIADLTRSIHDDPEPDSGLLLDLAIDTANVTQLINPVQLLVADSTPPGGRIFYTIDNMSVAVKGESTIILYYFAIEVQDRVPLGYLRKHYRFFRDNSTATKRRNWLGCKHTDETTVDGLPVIQIFIGEGTDLNVSPTLDDNEIKTGGGGTLNA